MSEGNLVFKKLIFSLALLFLLINFVSAAGFEVSNTYIRGSAVKGEGFDARFLITAEHTGDFYLSFNEDWAKISETNFKLNKGEQKEITVRFDSSKLDEGVYVSGLTIKEDKEEKIIPVVFEVESEGIIVDGNLDIPLKYREIFVGEKLFAQLKLFDLTSGEGGIGNVNVTILYAVFSSKGNKITDSFETLVFTKTSEISKSISFGTDIPQGSYILATMVKYGSSIGVSTAYFSIKKKGILEMIGVNNLSSALFVVLIIVGLLLAVYLVIKIKEIFFIKRVEKKSELVYRARRIFSS